MIFIPSTMEPGARSEVNSPLRVCFVCLGNICRSPTAEGVVRKLVKEAGLFARVELDSAGLGGWHADELPDARARQVARRRGVELSHRARRFITPDLDHFDLVLAMDTQNLEDLRALCRSDADRAKVRLFRSFEAGAAADAIVPDPYMGGLDGFEQVFDLCEAAGRGLVAHLTTVLPR
jgi:protein-tyrosine phosphatase